MIPGPGLSDPTIFALYREGDQIPVSNTIDYELGGIDLNDPSQGLMYQIWRIAIDNLGNIIYSAPTAGTNIVATFPGTTRISGTFDQNMSPTFAFQQQGTVKLYWFDSFISQIVVTDFPGIEHFAVTLDDKRSLQSASSDIIFAYQIGTNLYFRQQRDRFSIEYQLASDCELPLIKVGMNEVYRLQFQFGVAQGPKRISRCCSIRNPGSLCFRGTGIRGSSW